MFAIEGQWVELLESGDFYWLPGEKVAGWDYPGAHAWPIILRVGGGTRHPGHLAWKHSCVISLHRQRAQSRLE